MGSGSSGSARSNTTAPTFINPLTGVLANLFGLQTALSPTTGGIVLGTPGQGGLTAIPTFGEQGDPFSGSLIEDRFVPGKKKKFGGIFTPISGSRTSGGKTIPGGESAPFSGRAFFPEDFLSLRDQLEAPENLLPGGFGQDIISQALSNLGIFQNTIIPGAQELAETGFRTSASDLISNDILPQLREENILLGGQGFESDFQANALRQALSAQVGLDEAAAGRRTQGLSLFQQLAGFPLDFGADLAEFEDIEQQREVGNRPGSQILNLLFAAAGLPSDFSTGTTSKESSSRVSVLTG